MRIRFLYKRKFAKSGEVLREDADADSDKDEAADYLDAVRKTRASLTYNLREWNIG